jgi:hypothetical protein
MFTVDVSDKCLTNADRKEVGERKGRERGGNEREGGRGR